MSSCHAAALDNNNVDNPFHNDDVYVYKGEKADRRRIEHVRIDESVSIIGVEAFFHCEKLATVQFPATIRKIGKSCFSCCAQLKAVDLSHLKHLESIEEDTFYRCVALTTINLPPAMSSIGKHCFAWCGALKTVHFRATCVKEIGEQAFYYCKNLSSMYFPSTTKSIGKKSFYGCEKLSSLDLQATSVERIGAFTFCECINLQTINFPKTLRYIGDNCFVNCTKLEYLMLKETSIEEIGNHAFHNCATLSMVIGISNSHQEQLQEIMDDYGSMILPASLVDIGEAAFYECPALENSIDNNLIHYECDVNRGGRRFLQRYDHHHENNNDSNDDGEAKRHGKVYYSSLWPLILYRVTHEMKLPKQTICFNDDDFYLYTDANPLQRRASVVFYMLVHGVVADLVPIQSRNAQRTAQKQKVSSTGSVSSGLAKKQKIG